MEAVTPSPAYLVFSEVWYPGWQARLDGEPTSLLRANYAFRAVYLPVGEHTVELTFSPGSWRYASSVSLGTLLILFTIFLASLCRRTALAHD